ncbi:Carboxypeptidase regulatory-like domain-containing protein [Granulicella rosea]|uniref:Carboxypeptidase regulatory-like domain-containing protein n=1 Tax=Granulicella rosea TaxID=474952 RepID=A0A239MPE5_9BACT|nr:carboxypeptidase-like regulatory domain-containing protein [Granulicella rosea]SNT43972.1 Carboxypeptidase regulatory-like domain-containing protein [Granulicella rosea]
MRRIDAAACLLALATPCALAQVRCEGAGAPLAGVVHDTTAAVVPGASLTLDAGPAVVSGSDGGFRFACATPGHHTLHVSSPNFAAIDLKVDTPGAPLDVVLRLEEMQTVVEVNGEDPAPRPANATGATQEISGKRLQSLADDPDDLLRELQQLGGAAGANPANTSITVDGFQGDEGNTKLPPKSSIAYIKVNPDLYSAEYREPPFGGGHIEVYTKPGQSTFHGALFTTNGSPWMNARDPFSVSRAALGKQRYGFELTGPIRKQGSDFTTTLEHRTIDNSATVNAVTVDANDNQVATLANVATPQQRWLGGVRVDWQLNPKNALIVTYNADVNHLANVGVGGTTLAESGYDSEQFDHTLRIRNVTTASATLMHESSLSIEWDGEDDTPQSTAPQVQVSGAFTGGGTSVGRQRMHELGIEFNDDAIFNWKKHLLKIGIQTDTYVQHRHMTTNFNGSYLFNGGAAPALDPVTHLPTGQTVQITGLEQYFRATHGYAGGTPTDFSNVAGSPFVDIWQTRDAIYVQDSWKLLPRVQLDYGMRYFAQNNPNLVGSVTPRMGVAWSPDRKQTWSLHAHAGLFAGRVRTRQYAEIVRQDGIARTTSIAYNPVYCSVLGSACNPFTGITPVQSVRSVAPHLANQEYGIENLGFSHSFPHGWTFSSDYYIAQFWNNLRTENVNSPLNGSPTGPRPGPANLNIFQVQATGRGYGNAEFFGLDQHTLKRVQFFVGAVRVQIVDDTDDSMFSSPQTTGVNTGEYARRTGNPLWNVFGNASLSLPEKLQLTANFNGNGAAPYNITTGADNNGDGNFNDRPQYALPGTPGAVQTPWGLLVSSGGTASLPRNKGIMPWTVYLDMNLQRSFTLTKNANADHPQKIVLNVRSSNVLNHTNVTAIGGVLGSPLFGVAYGADNGRRIEGGVRYSF